MILPVPVQYHETIDALLTSGSVQIFWLDCQLSFDCQLSLGGVPFYFFGEPAPSFGKLKPSGSWLPRATRQRRKLSIAALFRGSRSAYSRSWSILEW